MDSAKEKKVFILIAMVVFLLGSFIVYKFFPHDKEYSDDPKDWISQEGVDLEQGTKDISYINVAGQQYDTNEVETTFTHDGFYYGIRFLDEYVQEGEVLIRFTKEIDPYNGIPEGFLFETFENEKPIVYIFLDEDWRDTIAFTNIVWGDTYQNSQQFSFNKEEAGIYYVRIEDDVNRFMDNYKIHHNGIIVGQITKKQVQENDLDNAIILRLS